MSFRTRQNLFKSGGEYKGVIARALGKAFGYGPDGLRKVMSATGASEVSARNWYEGSHSMRADYLAALLADSDEMLAEFLDAIGRADLADAARREATLAQIQSLINTLDGK